MGAILNLHQRAGQIISAVNPTIPVTARISVGPSIIAADGTQTPDYATPGAITAAIAGTTLTVSAISAGVLQAGQSLADLTTALLAGTTITEQLGGTPGGIGTYSINQPQTVASEAMTTSLNLTAQIQPVSWRDLQMVDSLTLQGTRYKMYLYGEIDGIVRAEKKGGDLIVVPAGSRHPGTYLVALVTEQFPDWCSALCTLQNGS